MTQTYNTDFYDVDSEVTIGKHKGKTVEEIAYEDIYYLMFMLENWDADFSEEVYDLAYANLPNGTGALLASLYTDDFEEEECTTF